MTESAYGDREWLVEYLGISMSNFYRRRPRLETEGLPRPDPILNRYLKADVIAWVENRRTVPDGYRIEESPTATKVKFDVL